LHNPEFTLLEWYRHDFTMDRLIDEVIELCRKILGEKKVVKKTYADIFRETVAIEQQSATVDSLLAFCKKNGIDSPPFDNRADGLNFVMSQFVEPRLPKDVLFFVHHYPAELAVLAKLDEKDPGTVLRFEMYCGGMELANGFEELGDAKANLLRLEEENRRRGELGKPLLPIDRKFIESLHKGFPFCSGVAVGLDRLVMLAAGVSRIDDVLTFAWEES
jgi:lysyl-tRNA synthetase class 2